MIVSPATAHVCSVMAMTTTMAVFRYSAKMWKTQFPVELGVCHRITQNCSVFGKFDEKWTNFHYIMSSPPICKYCSATLFRIVENWMVSSFLVCFRYACNCPVHEMGFAHSCEHCNKLSAELFAAYQIFCMQLKSHIFLFKFCKSFSAWYLLAAMKQKLKLLGEHMTRTNLRSSHPNGNCMVSWCLFSLYRPVDIWKQGTISPKP